MGPVQARRVRVPWSQKQSKGPPFTLAVRRGSPRCKVCGHLTCAGHCAARAAMPTGMYRTAQSYRALVVLGSAALLTVGFTPAWARGTAACGTRTREWYRPHYSSTSARALVGTLRTLVVFSLETTLSQSLQPHCLTLVPALGSEPGGCVPSKQQSCSNGT